jgi:hypothetical protein
VLCGELGNVVLLSSSPPLPLLLSGICLLEFAYKVHPIPSHVCGVQGDEIIRGFGPFPLPPSQEEVLWMERTAYHIVGHCWPMPVILAT